MTTKGGQAPSARTEWITMGQRMGKGLVRRGRTEKSAKGWSMMGGLAQLG